MSPTALDSFVSTIPQHRRVLKCAACGKTLRPRTPGGVDSSHLGLGPSCIKKYTNNRCIPGTNLHRLVMRLAFLQKSDREESGKILAILRVDGSFDRLVKRIAKRCRIKVPAFKVPAKSGREQAPTIEIKYEQGRIALRAPFLDETLPALRRMPGRRWDQDRMINTFPATAKRAVWKFLKRFYPGHRLEGPSGRAIIPG